MLWLTRPQWSIASFVCMLISLAALAYLYVWESFIWTLIFFFLTMICGFHWLFFRYDSLTQTHIRMIDYPYLMAGALGLLLVALQGQKDRDDFYRTLDDMVAPTTTRGLKTFVEDSISRLCENRPGWDTYDAYCNWVKGVEVFLSVEPTQPQLDEEIRKSDALGEIEHWPNTWANFDDHFPLAMSGGPTMRDLDRPQAPTLEDIREKISVLHKAQAHSDAALMLRSLKKIRDTKASPGSSPQADQTVDLKSKFIRFVAWPFILAFAVALRLTKVTADVSDWAVRG